MRPATVHDVAAAVSAETGEPLGAFKLHRLVYYCQAWHLVWEGRVLFPERIEAWASGPVVPALYEKHRGSYVVTAWPDGDPGRLSAAERESVHAVVGAYGRLSYRQLRFLACGEAPWREARTGLAVGERGSSEIDRKRMLDFYTKLEADSEAVYVDGLGTAI